jgi:hypothetical protein
MVPGTILEVIEIAPIGLKGFVLEAVKIQKLGFITDEVIQAHGVSGSNPVLGDQVLDGTIKPTDHMIIGKGINIVVV